MITKQIRRIFIMTTQKNQTVSTITCRLYIPAKYLTELNDSTKELFQTTPSGDYYSEFPAEVEDSSYLGANIIAYCEVVLITGNPKYEYTDECALQCELLKLGSDETSFNLLVNIKYPNHDSTFHDLLIFKEREQRLGFYSFELLGDQTLFSAD